MARTGRGWDAKPPDPRRAANRRRGQSRPTPDTPPEDPFDSDTDPFDVEATIDPASRRPPPADGRTPPWNAADQGDDSRDAGEPSRGRRTSLPWSAADRRDAAGEPGRGRRTSPWNAAGQGDDSRDAGEPSRGRRASLPWSAASAGGSSGGRRSPAGGDTPGEVGERGGRGKWGRGAKRGASGPEGGDTPEEQDPYELAREICLKQLSTRPRTRAELASAMKKRGVAQEVASAVLDRYGEVGMIDDAAFARAWVSSRHHSKGLAGRALAQELRQRGVEQEVAQEALAELDPQTEAETALELATRKLRSTRGEPEAVFRRLLGMLARKGYSGGVAVRAVKEALATRDAELADLIDPDVYEE